MSGPNSIGSRGVLDATPYLSEPDLSEPDPSGVDASKARASDAAATAGPTAERADGLVGTQRDAAEALREATGHRPGRGGRGGYGISAQAERSGVTVAELQAQRKEAARPELPVTLKDFVARFEDPANTPASLMTLGDVRSDLSSSFRHVFNGGQLRDCGAALDDDKLLRRELYTALSARGDLTGDQMDEITNLAVDQVEVWFASSVSAEITKVVHKQCDSALALLNVMDRNSDTRRGCLAEIAASCDSVEKAARALEGIGVSTDDSHHIAELLLEHADTAGARDALRSGEPGETTGYVFTEGAFDRIEGLLDNALDSSRSDIKQLRRDATSQRFDHDALLHSPKFAAARGIVLAREGIGGDDGKTRALREVSGEHASAKYREEVAITVLNTAFALAPGGQITFAGKLSVGVAMGMMGNAPGIAVAQVEVKSASAAITTGLGTRGDLRAAKSARNVAMAAAATQSVIGTLGAVGAGTSAVSDSLSAQAYAFGPAALGALQDGVVNLAAFAYTH